MDQIDLSHSGNGSRIHEERYWLVCGQDLLWFGRRQAVTSGVRSVALGTSASTIRLRRPSLLSAPGESEQPIPDSDS